MRFVLARPGAAFDRIPARLRFAVFLGVTLLISLGLTVLAYALYVLSGTSQLDLSRPGYRQALSEVTASSDDDDDSYPATGPLDKAALNEFKQKYDGLVGKTKDAKGSVAYDPSALSDDQLNLYATGATTPGDQ